jgi:thiol-disulfide isomerase/thioredoxin
MKNNLVLLFLIVSLFTGCKSKSFQISGKLVGPDQGTYLFLDELRSSSLKPIDSVKIDPDGTFSFKGNIDFPTFYLLKFSDNNFLTMLINPGEKIKIEALADSLNIPMSVTGSEGTQLMKDYNIKLKETIGKLGKLNDIYTENLNNPELPRVIEKLDSTARVIISEMNIYTKKYIDDNLSSMVSLVALYQQIAPGLHVLNAVDDIGYFTKVDSVLSSLYPQSEPVQALHTQVEELISSVNKDMATKGTLSVGAIAPEIALPSPEGDTIKLSSERGNIVLLDFWASWCSPCRLENPNLVTAYNKYRSKGFEIFQVSLDKTKEDWIKGINDDKLGRWIHVSDIKYWNSIVVPLYKIEGIPYNFLLDKEGKIIASNLRGIELQNKLAELFK